MHPRRTAGGLGGSHQGLRIQKGHFVVLTKEDFQAAAVEKTRTIDILDFVKADEIDDRYFETPYYLVPAKGGERAYALLREAMRESGRVGIAKFILRDAQHLAGVEVIEDAIVLSVMRFSDELVDSTVRLSVRRWCPQDGARDGQDARRQSRVRLGSAKYTDQYRENLLRVIKGKMKGQKVKLAVDEVPRQAEVVDLMERLRQSLAGAGTSTRAKARKPAKKAAAKKRTRAA